MRWLPLLFLLPACAEDDSGNTEEPPAEETPGDTYHAGLSRAGEAGLQIEFVDAVPAPPDRGDNAWTIELSEGGAPVDDCELTVTPFMPQHGHGTSAVPEITSMEAAGQYHIEPVNLFMPGLWEVDFGLKCGETTDQLKFSFWIEG